jgi:hypothetical protein
MTCLLILLVLTQLQDSARKGGGQDFLDGLSFLVNTEDDCRENVYLKENQISVHWLEHGATPHSSPVAAAARAGSGKEIP